MTTRRPIWASRAATVWPAAVLKFWIEELSGSLGLGARDDGLQTDPDLQELGGAAVPLGAAFEVGVEVLRVGQPGVPGEEDLAVP